MGGEPGGDKEGDIGRVIVCQGTFGKEPTGQVGSFCIVIARGWEHTYN